MISCALLVGLILAAAEEPRIFTLDAGVSVWDVAALDVNGDGRVTSWPSAATRHPTR